MNCKNCGFPLQPEDLFCKKCGAKVNNEEGESIVQETTEPNTVPNIEGVVEQPTEVPIAQEPVQPTTVTPTPQEPVRPYAAPVGPNPVQPTPMPQANAKPKSNNSKFIIIGVIAVIVILALIFILKPGKGGGVESTYKVRFNNFTIKVPTNIAYEKRNKALYIWDEEGTWKAAIETINLPFSQIQSQKNRILTVYKDYNAKNLNEKSYSGLDFITFEGTISGNNAIMALAKANAMYTFGVTTYNASNTYDYNVLSKIAKILKTAEYSDESNSIAPAQDIDMSSLPQLLNGPEEPIPVEENQVEESTIVEENAGQ